MGIRLSITQILRTFPTARWRHGILRTLQIARLQRRVCSTSQTPPLPGGFYIRTMAELLPVVARATSGGRRAS